jgi:hypothetical protein
MGSSAAVCTKGTNAAAPGRLTRNHWAPTVCIHVPIMLASWASQSARKAAIRRGDHAVPPADGRLATGVVLTGREPGWTGTAAYASGRPRPGAGPERATAPRTSVRRNRCPSGEQCGPVRGSISS